MKMVYIYYPGLAIAIILLILNVNLLWIFLSLSLGWYSVTKNSESSNSPVVIFFPLIRKFLKK